eukprot:scaffold10199_cov146-Cylindrotheca_fusiformis.AAC.9
MACRSLMFRRRLKFFFLCWITVSLLSILMLNRRMMRMMKETNDEHATPLESSFFNPMAVKSSLPAYLEPFANAYENSDFVELDHCRLDSLNWTEFRSWVDPIVETALISNARTKTELDSSKLKEEWTMELLELHAMHSGLCDFEFYHPRIRQMTSSIREAGLTLRQIVETVPVPPKQCRILFSIVAYKDSAHLGRLIEAIYLPQHLIIVHLEEQQARDDSFIEEVEAIASNYSNVAVVQFGTIIYKTDSISRVTLQLMYWATKELKLDFDYFAALGGAVYPLFGGLELSQHLYASQGKKVWLGEATMKGSRVQSSQSHLLWKQRLLATSTKVAVRAGKLFQDPVPDWMDHAMQHKSNSGNQAIFSFSAIDMMLTNPKVLNIFALAKYSCCCCVEERTWIAAMYLIGLLDEARENVNMFQLWGGANNRCIGSMNNAILDQNETRCFRNESPNKEDMYFWGNRTWDHLLQAKQKGLMFARKFSSIHPGSLKLLERIRVLEQSAHQLVMLRTTWHAALYIGLSRDRGIRCPPVRLSIVLRPTRSGRSAYHRQDNSWNGVSFTQ